MLLMANRIRPYSWGSRTAIADILGEPAPSAQPQAEMWIGAHPGDPSQTYDCAAPGITVDTDAANPVGGRSLIEVIAANPAATVGSAVTNLFGPRLPFLMKILAAESPLSLQVHPTVQQAVDGFAGEEAQGIPIDAPQRNYRDPWPKPEMICALSEFNALCGFRPVAPTLRLLRSLRVPRLDEFIDMLSRHPDAGGIRTVITSIAGSDTARLAGLCQQVAAACARQICDDGEFAAEARNILTLAVRHPADPGVLIALLMNHLTIRPGEAIYLPAGNLHAYLRGTGIEIMACSDNVLRSGLTSKHVDVPELMRVVDCAPRFVPLVTTRASGPGELDYPTATAEFLLSRLELVPDIQHPLSHSGPQILLVVNGVVTVTDNSGRELIIRSGRSVFVPAGTPGVSVAGHGTVFRARDGVTQQAVVA